MQQATDDYIALQGEEDCAVQPRRWSRGILWGLGAFVASASSVALVGTSHASSDPSISPVRVLLEIPSLARIAWNAANKWPAQYWLSGDLATGASYLSIKHKALFEVAIQDTQCHCCRR